MADDILTKKRITEYEETATMSTLRSDDVMYVDGQTLGTRKMSLLPILNNLFKSSGISVTDANYSTTITDVNSQPVNTIYTYAANLQSKISNLPSNFAVTILHFTPIFQASTAPGQVMLAIERTGDNKSLYFRTTSGSPAAWSAWQKVTNGSDVEAAITEALNNFSVETDETLSVSGKPADAKKVGDEITDVKEDLSENVGDLKSAFDSLALGGKYNVLNLATWTLGSYLTNTGGTSSSGTSYLSNYVEINGINKLYLKNKSTHVYRIAQYNAEKTYISNTYVNVSPNSSATVEVDSNTKYILVSIGDWSTLYTIDELKTTVEMYGSNYVSNTRDIAEKNAADIAELQHELSAFDYEYNVPVDAAINVGCFSKVGWTFYTTSWTESYRYIQMEVSAYDKFVASGFGNANSQFIMFFSGVPAEATYISGIGEGSDGESYTNYEVTVPSGANIMLVQSKILTGVPNVSVLTKTLYTQGKALEGKMYWKVLNGDLTVVAKYTDNSDFVVTFGKRGPNELPDFKTFSICDNANAVASDGSNAVAFIGDVTDWHSPFQVSAVNNADGDNPNSYYYTGGNHNYNNQSASGDGLATARNIYLKYYIDGIEVDCGAGYSNNIVAKWENNVQGYNTTKADGSGREILTETHELLFDGLKIHSNGYIEPLEDVYITSYYGYQFYGLGVNNAFNSGVAFIGATNRSVYDDFSAEHISGNADCNGINAIGPNNNLKLTVDVSYDVGNRMFYSGDKGCFTTQYGKGYTNLIASLSAPKGNRYYSRATWEFYPTIVET